MTHLFLIVTQIYQCRLTFVDVHLASRGNLACLIAPLVDRQYVRLSTFGLAGRIKVRLGQRYKFAAGVAKPAGCTGLLLLQ